MWQCRLGFEHDTLHYIYFIIASLRFNQNTVIKITFYDDDKDDDDINDEDDDDDDDDDDDGSMCYLIRHSEPAKHWKSNMNPGTNRQVEWNTTYEQVMDQRQW